MTIYIPEGNDDIIAWTENIKKRFPVFAKENGIPEEKAEYVRKACDYLVQLCIQSQELDKKGESNLKLEEEKTQVATAIACLFNK